MRILMVEDDKELCEAVEVQLNQRGYITDFCHSGDDAVHFALQNAYDLILLDRMLPEMDGVKVLTILRKQAITTPVLMMTAMNSIGDRVQGLDAGADDYLVKPFAIDELLARIRALARRPQQWESAQKIICGDVELDSALQYIKGKQGVCSLSKRETQLLELFFRNSSQVMPRTLLLSRVWGPDAPVEDGNLDNYVHFLRRRLKSVGSTIQIVTVRSVGYRLEEKPC